MADTNNNVPVDLYSRISALLALETRIHPLVKDAVTILKKAIDNAAKREENLHEQLLRLYREMEGSRCPESWAVLLELAQILDGKKRCPGNLYFRSKVRLRQDLNLGEKGREAILAIATKIKSL